MPRAAQHLTQCLAERGIIVDHKDVTFPGGGTLWSSSVHAGRSIITFPSTYPYGHSRSGARVAAAFTFRPPRRTVRAIITPSSHTMDTE